MSETVSDPASSNLWAKRFEVLVIRPVDMFLIVAAIVAFFHRDWKFSLFLFIIGFLVGAVGQGLPHHRHHSVADLTKAGPITSEVFRNAPEGQPPEHWNPDEGYKVIAASTKTGLILTVVVAVALLHFHFIGYVTVVASVLVLIGFVPLTLVILMAATTWSNRKNLKAWRAANRP